MPVGGLALVEAPAADTPSMSADASASRPRETVLIIWFLSLRFIAALAAAGRGRAACRGRAPAAVVDADRTGLVVAVFLLGPADDHGVSGVDALEVRRDRRAHLRARSRDLDGVAAE